MNLIKRNPDTWLPSVFDDVFRNDWLGGTTGINRMGTSVPSVNIQETEENFLVEVAAPGRSREDFQIELDNEILTISSEDKKENEVKENNGKYTRREFSYSSFKRSFSLPETIDSEKIAATYKNGVLEITLPKKEEAKAQPKRMIEIG